MFDSEMMCGKGVIDDLLGIHIQPLWGKGSALAVNPALPYPLLPHRQPAHEQGGEKAEEPQAEG